MNQKRNANLSIEERASIFHESYDFQNDPAVTLVALVRAGGDYLERIVGPETTSAAMAEVAKALDWEGSPEEWREGLEEFASITFTEWPLAQELQHLSAYAQYGIILDAREDDSHEAAQEQVAGMVTGAENFLGKSPLDQWLGPDRPSQLEHTIMLARNRWALDNMESVEPAALAYFGGLSEGRIRNMMSGSKAVFTNKGGKIPATEALAWLADRKEFYTSIWRDERLPQYAVRDRPPLREPVFVPVARDGSLFHPGLSRGAGFTIGPKGEEEQVDAFDEALRRLHAMPAPYWRRPNDAGSWGIVGGVRWERLDQSDLEVFAADPRHRLSPGPN